MIEEFVKQVTRLFSSKRNGGRLVYSLTDRLHYYKQIILSIGIILILGYAQFRVHFHCPTVDRIDSKTLTTFCWTNGTLTFHASDTAHRRANTKQRPDAAQAQEMPKLQTSPDSRFLDLIVPHVGIHFRLNENKYELVNHNYMRSLWALLIVMIACSYVASRQWSSIFSSDLMKALLRLPGNEELQIVKRAQELRVCEDFKKLAPPPAAIDQQQGHSRSAAGNKHLLSLRDVFQEQGQMFLQKIDIMVGDENDHNHDLDYYPNQLVYLLFARMKKLSTLKLKQQLLLCSLISLLLTVMQFLVPLGFIGPHYALYGWNYARLAVGHLMEQIRSYPSQTQVNSFDYELSSAIFPTSVKCAYRQYGLQGIEQQNVQCSVPINEICAKMFFIIWWLVAINILIELWSFLTLLVSSLSFNSVRCYFGHRYWPNARQEAKLIHSFRMRHANLLARVEAEADERLELEDIGANSKSRASGGHTSMDLESQLPVANSKQKHRYQPKGRQVISERDLKQFEAERESKLSEGSLDSGRWSSWCWRDVCSFLAAKGKQIGGFGKRPSKRFPGRQANGSFKDTIIVESKYDTTLYYLFYLLYLRFNCSRRKVEQVIQMTSEAITCYLDRLEQYEWTSGRSNPASSSTTSTTMIPSSVMALAAPIVSSSDATIATLTSTTTAMSHQP